MTGGKFVPGIYQSDNGFACEVLAPEPHLQGALAMGRGAHGVGSVPAIASQFFGMKTFLVAHVLLPAVWIFKIEICFSENCSIFRN
jgi:hypothetical protein